MTSVAHTAGPWRIAGRDSCDGRYDIKSDAARGDYYVASIIGGIPDAEETANANLIASAPALLSALQTTAGNIRSLGPAGTLDAVPMPYGAWLRVVELAIARAEGRLCSECKGAREICVGTSGRDDDGNAPIIERCETCDGSGIEP